jgi:hypothetical protein
MVDFQAMTKTDTVSKEKGQIRIECPLNVKGIASAICSADHSQKKAVRNSVRQLCG